MTSSPQSSTPSSPLDPQAGLRLRGVLLLALAGAGLAAFLLADHYRLADASFCSIGSWISCTEVNRSAYAELAGIPVAGIGLVGFLALFSIAFATLSGTESRLLRRPVLLLVLLSAAGATFGLALLVVELLVLETLCLLCLGAFGAQLAILALLVPLLAGERAAQQARLA